MTNKSKTRNNHFQVTINVPTSESFSDVEDKDLAPMLTKLGFVTQLGLETILKTFVFRPRADQKLPSKLLDYKGQLERGDKENRPHWQIYVETQSSSSAAKLATAFSNRLFPDYDENSSHPSIQVVAINNIAATIEYVSKPGRLELDGTGYWPGLISKPLIDFKNQLDTDWVLKEIEEKPREWQKYLLEIFNAPPDDRQIHWIADFTGNTGKSNFVRYARKKGLGIACYIDEIRAMTKAVIYECLEFERKYGKQCNLICFDLTKQVPGSYFDTFSSVLEMIKNREVRSTFGGYSKYEWDHNVHVVVFSNTAPLFNSLSRDRFNVYEIFGPEFKYGLRRSRLIAELQKSDGKFVRYRFVGFSATEKDMTKIYRKNKFEFSEWELEMLQVASTRDPDTNLRQLITAAEPVTQLESEAPQGVKSAILDQRAIAD